MSDLFINYRRGLDRHAAGRLYGELAGCFGKRRIFMDVDNIPAGVDFELRLERSLSRCSVLLSVIGPGWASVRDERGRLRLFQPNDFVRLEISAALKRGIRVVPVLLDNASLPANSDLPLDLHGLLRCNAVWLRHDRFSSDVLDLVKSIRSEVGFVRRIRRFAFSLLRPRSQAERHSGNHSNRGGALGKMENAELVVVAAKPHAEVGLAGGASDVQRFVVENVVRAAGHTVSATSMYEAYCVWCEDRGKEPLALPTFGREVAEFKIQKVKKKDGVLYAGIAFRDDFR